MSGVVVINPPPPPPPPPSLSSVDPAEWESAWNDLWQQACVAVQAQTPAVVSIAPAIPVKPWWRSRMMWLGIAATAAGLVLEVLTEEREIALQAFGVYGPPVILGLGLVVKFLRLKTVSAVGKVPS